MTDNYINFDEYIRQGEPAQRERVEAWRVAIGLQTVDEGAPKGQRAASPEQRSGIPAASPMNRIGISTTPW